MSRVKIALSIMVALATCTITAANADTYKEWAAKNQAWVQTHPERAHFFAAHPEAAEKWRSEWSEWHEEKVPFSEWAEHHPEWVAKNKHRFEQWKAHPEMAEQHHAEWLHQKESHHEYQEWAKNHEWKEHH